MTASALAGELKLPLFAVQLHGLITKFMGETAAKLYMIFDAMSQTRESTSSTSSMPSGRTVEQAMTWVKSVEF